MGEYASMCKNGSNNATIRVLLDSYARRHEAQKIFLRQGAAQRWVEFRDQVLQGHRPSQKHRNQLRACDHQLRSVSYGPCPNGSTYFCPWFADD